jgi:hypothetical protein
MRLLFEHPSYRTGSHISFDVVLLASIFSGRDRVFAVDNSYVTSYVSFILGYLLQISQMKSCK